jgi:hypothetical protein
VSICSVSPTLNAAIPPRAASVSSLPATPATSGAARVNSSARARTIAFVAEQHLAVYYGIPQTA